MCARDAYPNGEAREEVIATRRRGMRIRRLGIMGGVVLPLVSYRRYMYPERAAKRDCTVLRNTGNLNFSGEDSDPYGVVVSRSWRSAHVRLWLRILES